MTGSQARDTTYLIIGGATKAATTSLFNYLADHPHVCASSLKETRFFLDPEYPLAARHRLEDGLHKYETFFTLCRNSRYRLEATPDYLYSPGTAQKIRTSLPAVKLIFVLREPVSRLISWYRFAVQTGRIDHSVSLHSYVSMQLNEDSSKEQHLRALEQGCYSKYLRSFFDVFDRDQILIVFYEPLAEDPAAVLRNICNFADLDPLFYSTYRFEVFNRTMSMKKPVAHKLYIRSQFRLRRRTHNKPQVQSVLRRIKNWLEPVYLRLNTRSSERVIIGSSLEAFLRDYYRDEKKALEVLLARVVPWPS